jgi:hypothetical protein
MDANPPPTYGNLAELTQDQTGRLDEASLSSEEPV